MSQKIINKYINDVSTCIDDNLKGFVQVYPGLKLISNHRVVMINFDNQPLEKDKVKDTICKCISIGENKITVIEDSNVGVICGGGGGHEPFAAGYVGYGMLNAAISGSVFASPPTVNILYAIRTIAQINKGGVLVIIPNYTGDCLNFGLAIETAIEDGIRVDSVIVNDDCALIQQTKGTDSPSKVGARGLGAMVIVQKISGAMACDGHKLEDIVAMINNNILNNVGSMGCCLRACSLPGQSLLFEIDNNEIEMGVGLHGEAGFRRTKYTTLHDILKELIQKIITSVGIQENDSIVLLVNNLGGLAKIEENIINNQLVNILNNTFKIKVLRIYSGNIITSLDMHGVQITILNMKSNVRKDILKYLDAHTEAPAWPKTKYIINNLNNNNDNIIEDNTTETSQLESAAPDSTNQILSDANILLLKKTIYKAAQAIIENEQYLNKLDSGCGDGDCGSTLKLFAKGITLTNINDFPSSPFNIFKKLSTIAESKMGGTSGAIYSLFFTGITKYIKTLSTTTFNWSHAINNGLGSIMKYSKAKEGDRTMLDVLIPVCNEIKKIDFNDEKNINNVLNKINELANQNCDKTKFMQAKAGRAAYVEYQSNQDVDAGAYAVKIIVNNIVDTIIKS